MSQHSEPQAPPRLAGYESWLYQMPCINCTGDVFVSVRPMAHAGLACEPPTRWLIAVGDVIGIGDAASRLKKLIEAAIARLASTMSDPASILEALNADPLDPDRFPILLVAVIDSERHEMVLANAGHPQPFLRHVDRQTVLLGEQNTGCPLWIDPGHRYENVAVPMSPGEIVVFHTDGVTAVSDHEWRLFDTNHLRQAIVHAHDGAVSVGRAILEAVHRFGKGRAQQADITLLCIGRVVPTRQPL